MTRWRLLAQWLIATWPVQWFIQKTLPVVRFTVTPPKMNTDQFKRFMQFIQPGDIVFSVDRSKLATVMIGGFWAHVGVVDKDLEIVEAHFPKVRRVHPAEFCFTSDIVGMLRPKSEELKKHIAEKSGNFVGMPYDTLFVDGRESLYCSELVWTLDSFNTLGFDTKDEIGLGIGYVSPDDIWNSTNINFKIMFGTKLTHSFGPGV